MKRTLILSVTLAASMVFPARLPSADAPGQTKPANPNPPAISEEDPPLHQFERLHYTIREDPIKGSEPLETSVRANGTVDFKYSRVADELITIDAKGKTLAQIKKELKARLEADYYHKATVDLKITSEQVRKRGQVIFLGQASNVLSIEPGERLTIHKAFAKINVTKWADLSKVELRRINPVTGKTEKRVIDVKTIQKDPASDKNIELQDEDTIYIPERNWVFGL
jgi:protein involved in polysaccharide export with SLBB domain